MQLELISTKRCPNVQRSVITLNRKGIAHDVTYVDLDNKPDWFTDISPFGLVPVLRVDNESVIFESAVINEFLDEITPGQLHPEDPLLRAMNRSWIVFGGDCNSLSFQLMTAPDRQDFETTVDELKNNLGRVEALLGDDPYFNGSDFALIDAAYAPLFIRLDILNKLITIHLLADFPKIQAWSDELLSLPEVQAASVPELPDLYRQLMRQHDSYAHGLLAA